MSQFCLYDCTIPPFPKCIITWRKISYLKMLEVNLDCVGLNNVAASPLGVLVFTFMTASGS